MYFNLSYILLGLASVYAVPVMKVPNSNVIPVASKIKSRHNGESSSSSALLPLIEYSFATGGPASSVISQKGNKFAAKAVDVALYRTFGILGNPTNSFTGTENRGKTSDKNRLEFTVPAAPALVDSTTEKKWEKWGWTPQCPCTGHVWYNGENVVQVDWTDQERTGKVPVNFFSQSLTKSVDAMREKY
ncbi:uncharacterized protein C8R40DRAFT_1177588 [Lentinula edodes]|uniref:uncharacterized protein n=1 Tax=Lentinula edodes TaxID=5353 RepID=UPI001E8E115B|nr:uncharacterized protein C8R40DRAFT_1177588 [Lentinula edodes]KAH7868633.1 hypothetical protein C8R40DRAFT_1177588 [Lentinula edodes]